MEEKFDVLNELGEFTGKIASREECHKKGLWHRAVYAFVIDEQGNIINKHFNECYLIIKNIDITDLRQLTNYASLIRSPISAKKSNGHLHLSVGTKKSSTVIKISSLKLIIET